jgi:hypothetical protein
MSGPDNEIWSQPQFCIALYLGDLGITRQISLNNHIFAGIQLGLVPAEVPASTNPPHVVLLITFVGTFRCQTKNADTLFRYPR